MTRYLIPSYRRADRVFTVETLTRGGVDPDSIEIWCSDPSEVDRYSKNYDVACRVGQPGLPQNRQAAADSCGDGVRVVFVDDDISEVLSLEGGKLVAVSDIPALVAHGFDSADKAGCGLWGLMAAANPGFMTDEEVAGLRYIVGAFYGVTTPTLLESGPSSGEDFARTLRYFLSDGAVYRLNWATVKTSYFDPGGIDAEITETGKTRFAVHGRELRRLAFRYPDLVTAYTKAGGITNLRLARITNNRYARPDTTRNDKRET